MRNAGAAVALWIVTGLLPSLASEAAATPVAVVGSLTHRYQVEPGQRIEDSIEVRNVSETLQAVAVAQSDYFFTADGRAIYGPPGRLARSNARWISFAPTRAVIPPHQSARLHYTIAVPLNAALKGTYWSVLLVRPLSEREPVPRRPESSQISVTIRELFQYAVQIATDVGSGADRQVKFVKIDLLDAGSKAVLAVDVENTGEQALSGTLWTELYDGRGQPVGRFPGGRRGLYPGTSARFTTELAGVTNAPYRALIIFDCGGDDVFAARANLTPGH